MTAKRAFIARRSLRDLIERAAVSVSNNIAEGFERGTTEELPTFLYIARGSEGEVRSMLCLIEQLPGFEDLKSEISNFKSVAEGISPQLRGWADSLQNSGIKGQRYLTEKTRQANRSAREHEEFMAELRRIREGLMMYSMADPISTHKAAHRLRSTLIVLTSLGAFAGTMAFAAWRVGGWLVVSDPLKPARAIVVLSGSMPFRAMEAAKIYGQGWAPEVWVTRNAHPSGTAALARLGIKVLEEDFYSVEVLEKMGVPSRSIRVLAEPARNTEEEERVIAKELRSVGGERIIIVTSKPHTRRTRAIWRAIVGDTPEVIVRGSTDEPYDATHWWRSTDDAAAVEHEVMGLFNFWSGLPSRARR
jgi:four helix bundle protein